jgi:glycosyltransferase involved in cell wall biosynthesis
MKVSVIIPYMEADDGKEAVLNRLLDSLVGADEIIIAENWKAGYAVPINFGLSQATGDYLIVMNDDLIQRSGDLHQLCDPKAVTSPIEGGLLQEMYGNCFCIPRWVYEATGGLDERYRISYFDDDDFINELRKRNILMHGVSEVEFENVDGGGRTLHTFADHNSFFEHNKQLFTEKWGGTPDQVTSFFKQFGRLPDPEEDVIE